MDFQCRILQIEHELNMPFGFSPGIILLPARATSFKRFNATLQFTVLLLSSDARRADWLVFWRRKKKRGGISWNNSRIKLSHNIKVANTKYTNYRSVDQSHQNSAIRAEATSLSLPWRISLFYHRQAKRLEIFKLSWKGNNRHGMVTATATVCHDYSQTLTIL